MLIFLLQLEISGVAVQKINKKSENRGFFLVAMTLRPLKPFPVMNMVPVLLRQFRRLLQVKKIITNAPRVLYFSE